MTARQHLGRILCCALLSRHWTGKSAVENEFLAQFQIHRQLRRCFELMLLLPSHFGSQLE